MTYYEILEVSETASSQVIHVAYKILAVKHHPDRSEGDPKSAQEYLKWLNIAYSVLSDPEKRKQYDMYLKQQREQPKQKPAGNTHNENTDNDPEPGSVKSDIVITVVMAAAAFVLALLPHVYPDGLSFYSVMLGFVNFTLTSLLLMTVPLLVCTIKKECSSKFIGILSAVNCAVFVLLWNAEHGSDSLDGWFSAMVYFWINLHLLTLIRARIQKRKSRIIAALTIIIILFLSSFGVVLGGYALLDAVSNTDTVAAEEHYTYYLDENGELQRTAEPDYYVDIDGNITKKRPT